MFLNENLLEMSFQYHQYHSTVSKDLYTLRMKPVDLSLLLAVKLTILQTLKFMLSNLEDRPSTVSAARVSWARFCRAANLKPEKITYTGSWSYK